MTQYWQSTSVVSCKPHQEWLQIGDYKVFLKSSYGDIDTEVDVFIDLTGGSYLKRVIPPQLQELLGTPSIIIMEWEISDGYTCSQLPGMVVTLLEAGYTVGWGCIGGHGRTGWLAAKVYKILTGCTGNEAVDYVRNNYCSSAIETQSQLTDLESSRPAKPVYTIPSSTGRKWDYQNKQWVEEAPTPDKAIEDLSDAELQKELEPKLGESDEDYEARTDILLERYYSQFDKNKLSIWEY